MGLFSFIKQIFGKKEPKNMPMISLVLLLDKPREIDKISLDPLLKLVLKTDYTLVDQPIPDFAKDTTTMLLQYRNYVFSIMSVNRQYFDDSDNLADKISFLQLKNAISQHKAWFAIDLINAMGPMNIKEIYQIIGKLIAGIASDDCLAIYCPDGNKINIYSADIKGILASENPLEAFGEMTCDPVINVSIDDEKMKVAVEEAKRRLPEFLEMYKCRKPDQIFAVKAEFKDGDESEFMWIMVERIDADSFSGPLSNEPAIVKNIKENNMVTIKFKDLNDWMVTEEADIIAGGFTTAVLMGEE